MGTDLVMPQDYYQDWHGTAVAGLACAAGDGKVRPTPKTPSVVFTTFSVF